MSDRNFTLDDAIGAYLHASIMLETIVPGSVVDDVDGLRHVHYGRPKANVWDEVYAGETDPAQVVDILRRHPELAPVYVSTFVPLDVDEQPVYEDAGFTRVVRNTLMSIALPDVTPFSDPTLRRLTDPEELRALARIRDGNVLDVDHFTDAIGCYVLDIDGEFVSSALMVPSTHDTAVIEHVQTLNRYRRRGYGRWLLRALHAEAARAGLHRVVLGSNETGRPLYTALGYTPLCYGDVFLAGG